MSLPRITFGTVVKLLLASFLVGMVLAYLDIQPADILAYARSSLEAIAGDVSGYANWAMTYILLGAVIVVPIWLISYIWRAARNKP